MAPLLRRSLLRNNSSTSDGHWDHGGRPFHLVLRQLHSSRLRTSGPTRSATLGQFKMLCAVLPVRHARPVQDALRGPRYRRPHDLHDWPVSRRSQTLRGSCRPCTRTGRGLPLRHPAPGVARPRHHLRVVHPRGAPGYPSLRRPLQGTPRSGAASRAFATTGMFRGPATSLPDAAPDGAQFDFGASSAQSVAHRPADERTAPAWSALQRMIGWDEAPVTSLLESVARGGTPSWAVGPNVCNLWTPPRYRANCSSTRPPSMTVGWTASPSALRRHRSASLGSPGRRSRGQPLPRRRPASPSSTQSRPMRLGLRPSGDSRTRSTTSRPPETSGRRGSPQRTSTVVAARPVLGRQHPGGHPA